MDAIGFRVETPAVVEPWRTVLLDIRDNLVPRIPEGKINMATVDCGTHACLIGWYERLVCPWPTGDYGLSGSQIRHLFWPAAYGGEFGCHTPTSHAELRAHIDDVLTGRVS